MPRTVLQGRASHKARSLITLWATALGVIGRRLVRRPRAEEWGVAFEIGTVFFRRQFDHALSLRDIEDGRAYFDSLYTVVGPDPDVDVRPSTADEPRGNWFIPRSSTGSLTLLFLHGGGYAFDAAVSRHFIAALAGWTQVPIFAPSYRLTPEHPHPAQLDDAITAYRWLLARGTDPRQLVVCGDSAGGHLLLMLLSELADLQLPQPAIGIALSPWTHVGERGASQFGNDRYDMVQGYQTILYGQWLRGDTDLTLAQLSPITRNFRDAAPIYLQAGGKEILVDMIRDFARVLVDQDAEVRLDVWPHMVHEFHAYGDTLPESHEAIEQIRDAIAWATGNRTAATFPPGARTEIDHLRPHDEAKQQRPPGQAASETPPHRVRSQS